MRSPKSCFHASFASSGISAEIISSMELTLRGNQLKYVRGLHEFCICTHLQFVLSLKSPSSSSDPWRLWVLECVRECTAEGVREDIRLCAFFDTVLPLSRACRRKSCMMAILMQMQPARKLSKYNELAKPFFLRGPLIDLRRIRRKTVNYVLS